MRLRLASAGLALGLALCAGLALRSNAADEPAAKIAPKAAPAKKAAAAGDVVAEWAALLGRREQMGKQLEKLQKDFQAADDAGKREIAETFQKLVTEFEGEIQPRMIKLAPAVFAKDPTNLEAAEIVAGNAYQANDYGRVIEISDKLAGSEKKSAVLLNLGGIAHFAVHDFEAAQKMLQEAQKADSRLFPQLGARYIDQCPDYIEFWKEEQAIREKEAAADDLPRVLFKTNRGDILLELFENEAPNTVANFVSLVAGKKYDGTAFHRVIPSFMAQGGDPNSLDEDPSNDGTGGPGYHIACECYSKKARRHFQGSLSMAHAGKDSGGSQFFLTHLPTPHLNANVEQQRGHTVFGRIIKGMEVAAALKIGDKIESATVVRKRDHAYTPKKLADGSPQE